MDNEMAENRIDAVLFDLDGVLVFTDKYHYRSWKMLAERMGWQFDESLNHRLRGIPRRASLQVVLDFNRVQADSAQKSQYAGMKNEFYLQMLRSELDRSDMYPGVLEFLETLRARGVSLALCSSSKNARTVLDRLDLNGYFQAVVAGDEVKAAKPAPEIFLLGASKLGVDPGRCLVFEDAGSGIRAAQAAGMNVIGVGDPHSAPGAEVYITRYDSIDIDAMLVSGSV